MAGGGALGRQLSGQPAQSTPLVAQRSRHVGNPSLPFPLCLQMRGLFIRRRGQNDCPRVKALRNSAPRNAQAFNGPWHLPAGAKALGSACAHAPDPFGGHRVTAKAVVSLPKGAAHRGQSKRQVTTWPARRDPRLDGVSSAVSRLTCSQGLRGGRPRRARTKKVTESAGTFLG